MQLITSLSFRKKYRALQAVLFALVIFESLAIYSHLASAKAGAPVFINNTAVAATNTAKSSGSTATKSSPATTSTPPKARSATIPAAPMCQKTAANPVPGKLILNPTQNGLVQNISQKNYYKVYGYTAAQVENEIGRCTPITGGGSDFAASTNYTIDWSFSYSDDGDSCRAASAAVGVHVIQIYPQWIPSPYATTGYASRWQTFIDNLNIHENGHRSLDVSYANKILQDLQNLSASSCDALKQTASTEAEAEIEALNQANNNYDAVTNHGQTQGAVIPAY